MLSIYVTQKKSKKLRSFKSFSVRVLQNLKKKKRKEKLHLILKKCLESSDREVSLALIVIDEYPGDIFFVSTRLLLWLPRDL